MTGTDLQVWRETATGEQPKWEGRAQIIARFIRPGDVVLDLGAGDQKLKKYLTEYVRYVPVDCVDNIPGTFVCDYNAEFKLPKEAISVVIAAGFFEYIVDLEGLLKKLSEAYDGVYMIFTISYRGSGKASKYGYNKFNSFKNSEEVFECFEKYTGNLQHMLHVRNQSYFSAVLGQSAAQSQQYPRIDQAMKRPRKWPNPFLSLMLRA